MRLDLATHRVTDVVAADQTSFEAGLLRISLPSLRDEVMRSGEFADVQIEIVRSGDNTRIVHVVDVVEPRMRLTDEPSDFPGLLSAPKGVGSGRTARLSGVVVTEVAEPLDSEATYWREAIVDMGGRGAELTPLSEVIHVVISLRPDRKRFVTSAGANGPQNVLLGAAGAGEFNRAVRIAGLKAAVYLANAASSSIPDDVTTFDLDERRSDLPNIVYMFQMSMAYVYGDVVRGAGSGAAAAQLPTLIHPNEIFDGAVVNSFSGPASTREVTQVLQNHPIIQDLYRRHGDDINFRGVVMYTSGDSTSTKERMSSYAANLAGILDADGAILSGGGSGSHASIDCMLTLRKLEQHGIKTALVSPEMAGNPADSGFTFFVREADAIASVGNYEQVVELPKDERAVGGSKILESGQDAAGPMSLTLRHVLGSTDRLGSVRLRGRAV
jgi:glycine reductase